MRWQTGAAVALLVALAAVAVVTFARDGSGTRVAASPTPTTDVVATASPSPGLSPASSPSPELVLPANDVDDPLEAIVAIEAYRDWLFANPDPALVRFIYHPECGCAEPLQASLEALVADGQHIELEGSTELRDLTLVRDEDGRVVTIELTATTPPLRLVGSDGAVRERRSQPEVRNLRVSMARGDGGRWLITFIQDAA